MVDLTNTLCDFNDTMFENINYDNDNENENGNEDSENEHKIEHKKIEIENNKIKNINKQPFFNDNSMKKLHNKINFSNN